MEVMLKYKVSQLVEQNYQLVTASCIEYGIWDHQEQKLVSRNIRHVKNKYKKTETRYPRTFTQMNHAQSALAFLSKKDPEAYLRYEAVSITTLYKISTTLPAEHRKQQLVKRQALSKLTPEERAALGIKN